MNMIQGKTINGGAFVVEECVFVNSVLRDCDLFYSGGDFEYVNTTFENCRWHFRGPALKTIQLGQTIGMIQPQQQMPPPSPVSKAKMN
jgi:hypothetical protein